VTIPASLAGLLFFTVMLWPGLTYTTIRERMKPMIRRSPFREALDVISVSLLTALVVAMIVVVSHLLMPRFTPQPNELLFDTQRYVEEELTLVGAWAVVALVLSQGFAAILALGLLGRLFLPVFRRRRDYAGLAIHESQLSAWWIAFTQYPVAEAIPYVGCQLSDGSYVSGLLHSYSRDWEDLPDRDLVLLGPIQFRPPKANQVAVLEGVGTVVVSARNIVMITVTYQPAEAVPNVNSASVVDGGSPVAAVDTSDASTRAGEPGQQPSAAAVLAAEHPRGPSTAQGPQHWRE
jgi:hypothetical protein